MTRTDFGWSHALENFETPERCEGPSPIGGQGWPGYLTIGVERCGVGDLKMDKGII